MSNHHVTLETAQRLKAAGFPQSTLSYWFFGTEGQQWYIVNALIPEHGVNTSKASDRVCAAPILTEVLEQLPHYVSIDKSRSNDDDSTEYGAIRPTVIGVPEAKPFRGQVRWPHSNPVEAAALLWLKLKEANAI